MKAFKTLALCASAWLLASCGNEDVSENVIPEFKVNSSILPHTQAQIENNGSGHFETGDKNSLFFHTAEGKMLQTFEYTYGSTYYWSDIKLPEENHTCKLSACYPNVKTETPANFKWDVTASTKTPDFLAANPIDVNLNSPSPVKLTFNHMMHNLEVKLVSNDPALTEEELQSAQLTLRNFYPIAVLDLLQGKAKSAEGNKAQKTVVAKNTNFIIPAQKVESMELEIKMLGRTHVFKLAEIPSNGSTLNQLESGKTFTITLTATKNSFVISGQEITGWGNQGEFDGNITI